MPVADIRGETFRNEGDHRVERTYVAKFDSVEGQDGIVRAYVRSFTHPERTVYTVEVSFRTLEVECGCLAGHRSTAEEDGFRETNKGPYNRKRANHFLENLAWEKGYRMSPCITRPPRFLCKHARVVRRIIWRRGIKEVLLERERELITKLLAAPVRTAARAA